MASLHTGRFVVVHLCSSFHIDPQNFSRGANFYQKLPFFAIFGVVRPQFYSYNVEISHDSAVLCLPPPGKMVKIAEVDIPLWGKFITKIAIFGKFLGRKPIFNKPKR